MKTSLYITLFPQHYILVNALLKCALKVKLCVFAYRLIDKFVDTKHFKKSIVSCKTKRYSPLQQLNICWKCNTIPDNRIATEYVCWRQKKSFCIAVSSLRCYSFF